MSSKHRFQKRTTSSIRNRVSTQDKFKPTLLVELRSLVLLQPVGELHAGNRQAEDHPARADASQKPEQRDDLRPGNRDRLDRTARVGRRAVHRYSQRQ